MTNATLIIGNKNYSSWSLRGWLAVKTSGIEFDEKLIPLFEAGHTETLAAETPANKVSVLIHNGRQIWESLAIAEYVAEINPGANMWPEDAGLRAKARSVSCEMLSGFTGIRSQYHMNCRRIIPGIAPTDATSNDITRIKNIWAECLANSNGPFLFGTFSIADIMYAPVVSRFNTYGVTVDKSLKTYMAAILSHPFMQDWYSAAKAEEWVIDTEEY